jgi:hypothetical protein
MSDIETQRTAMADQPAADDYPTLGQRYPAAEPLFFTCMCGPFASILSAAVASEALVAEVNSHFASGREPIGDPPPDDGPDDDDDDDQ